MKLISKVGVLLVTFLLGGFAAWIVFREPVTLLRASHSDNVLSVYSYYLNSRGEEVQHGWSYRYRFEGGAHLEDQERFDRGRSVYKSSDTRYRSEEQFDSPPAFLHSIKKEPNQSSTARRP